MGKYGSYYTYIEPFRLAVNSEIELIILLFQFCTSSKLV
jgi:hypothetical protein